MSRASMGLLAVGLWAGCLMPGPWWLAAAAVPGLLLAVVVARRRRAAGLVAAAVLLAVAGSGLAGGRLALRDAGPLAELARAGHSARFEATAVTDAREQQYGSWLLVRVTLLDGRQVRGRALLRLGAGRQPPQLGDRLGFRAGARPLEAEGFDGYLRTLGAAAALHPHGDLDLLGPPPAPLRVSTAARDRARAAFVTALPPAHAALLGGLVTGDRRGSDAQRDDELQRSGLTHLVVVSGRHVALMLAGVVGLAGLMGAGFRGRRWIALAALAWFVVLVRWQPSVLRAAVMATLVLLAGLLGRAHDAVHVLAVTVVLLLLIDPLLAVQLGFVLSVLATAGVVVLAPALADRLRGPPAVRLALGVTLGAQLAVSPVLFQLGDGLAAGAVPANLVAGPAAAVAQPIGLVAALVAQVAPEAGAGVAWLAWPALSVVLWAASAFADLPALDVDALLSPAAVILACAVALRRRRPRLAAAGMALAVVLAVVPRVVPPADTGTLRVVMLDVGQGDALLIEAPHAGGTARLLVDGGPDAYHARDALRRRRIRRLDAVVLSHPHHDHSGGLPEVLRRLEVGVLVVAAGRPADTRRLAPSVVALHAAASTERVPVRVVAAGHRFTLGAATVAVLAPPPRLRGDDGLNDGSVVLRVASEHGSVLLTGDAEESSQQRMLRDPGSLRATVLKVPHHGGATNAPGFVQAVDPAVALVSVGQDNDYGHPAPSVLTDLTGRAVVRTDLHGTVTVTLSPAGPRVETTRPAAGASRHITLQPERANDIRAKAPGRRQPVAAAVTARAESRRTAAADGRGHGLAIGLAIGGIQPHRYRSRTGASPTETCRGRTGDAAPRLHCRACRGPPSTC